MARGGLLAGLQRQAKIAAREQARSTREAKRANKAAIREIERVRKAEERAVDQLARASVAESKQRAKEASAAHKAAMMAEVDRRNLELTQVYHEIDSLLEATINVDDYVDLDTLRTVAKHPPFDRTDLEVPVLSPPPILDPPKPVFIQPPQPKGLKALFGGKKHAKEVAEATASHERAVVAWQSDVVRAEKNRKTAADRHVDKETQRATELKQERVRYDAECEAREAEAAERNQAIDKLIADLSYGAVNAVQEYIWIVLSNSVYPAHFPIEHKFTFEAETAELQLRVLAPSPDKVPSIKAYKYTKSSDEITTTPLSQKACKDRYAGAMHQVALRSLHEVFEADRRGLINTISLEVGAEAINPATGQEEYILFVATGAERNSFLELNLSNVVPAATLAHMGAAVSKNPHGFVAADASGVRRS